jgi:YD repeat-containing protein
LQTQAQQEFRGEGRTVITDAVRYGPEGRIVTRHAPVAVVAPPTVRHLVPATAPATEYIYDEFARVVREVYPDGAATSISWRKSGVERRCDARHGADPSGGQCVELELDGFRRVAARRVYLGSNGAPYSSEERFYNGAGWLTGVRQNGNPNAVVRFTYDALGRRRTVTNPDGGTTTFGYDLAGNVI